MKQSYKLTLAHINDTHSHFEPSRVHFKVKHQGTDVDLYSHTGGYARIKYQVDKARNIATSQQREFLFLHGGDSFQGTLYYSEFKGRANAHLLSLMAPDAMVLGNHEIDAGNGPVKDFIQATHFPILAGNMDLSREEPGKHAPLNGQDRLYDFEPSSGTAKPLLKPFYDKQLAIIGITLDQMKEIARPDPDTYYINAIETTRRTINKLKSQGIEHIIVLSHLGVDQDRTLAEQVDGISLIVGGHTHTLQGSLKDLGLSDMTYGERVNSTPILHAGKYAETLGLAEIEFDDVGKVTKLNGTNHFMLDKQFILPASSDSHDSDYRDIQRQLEAHPSILWDDEDVEIKHAIHKDYRPRLDALENQILGFVPKALVHTRLPSKALPHGSQISPWVSKAMFRETKAIEPSIQFALHNAGGVRQSMEQGNISVADVIGRILPFELPLMTYKIQGSFLYQALESAINAATNNSVQGTGAGSFPYTYGLRYFYDGRRPLGQRIIKLEVLDESQEQASWQEIVQHLSYIGVSTSYTASGKEGYQALLEAQWQKPIEGLLLSDAFINFVKKREKIDQELVPQVHYTSHRQS